MLDASGPADSVQYQAQLAVNKNGVLAVTWFDTRAASDLGRYDEYFTAPVDSGVTFLKSARVSSKTSQMFGIGNMQIIPSIWRHENLGRVSFTSPSTRWRSAGDYRGLAADTDGTFHPLWSDSRSGTFQIWTATIQVSTAAEPASIAPDGGELPT
ncbi:MAG: hypothetical protein ACR2NN_22675 [Bryobacteraceae bacterium]